MNLLDRLFEERAQLINLLPLATSKERSGINARLNNLEPQLIELIAVDDLKRIDDAKNDDQVVTDEFTDILTCIMERRDTLDTLKLDAEVFEIAVEHSSPTRCKSIVESRLTGKVDIVPDDSKDKGLVLRAIQERAEDEARKIQKVLDLGLCKTEEMDYFNGRLIELVKFTGKIQQAIAKHTSKMEQLARITTTAQSFDDIDKAKEYMLNSFCD